MQLLEIWYISHRRVRIGTVRIGSSSISHRNWQLRMIGIYLIHFAKIVHLVTQRHNLSKSTAPSKYEHFVTAQREGILKSVHSTEINLFIFIIAIFKLRTASLNGYAKVQFLVCSLILTSPTYYSYYFIETLTILLAQYLFCLHSWSCL